MKTTVLRIVARHLVIGVALASLAGCMAAQPPPADPGPVIVSPNPAPPPVVKPRFQFSPADQCLIARTSYNGAAVGLDFLKVDDAQTQAAVDAGLASVSSAAEAVCAAAAQGESPKAVSVLFGAFNDGLADFHANMQAIKRARLGLPPVTPVAPVTLAPPAD